MKQSGEDSVAPAVVAPPAPPAAAAEADAPRATKSVLTPEELLMKHYPHYFYDKNEKYFPVDLNQ